MHINWYALTQIRVNFYELKMFILSSFINNESEIQFQKYIPQNVFYAWNIIVFEIETNAEFAIILPQLYMCFVRGRKNRWHP